MTGQVIRLRAKTITDPYSETEVSEDWSDPEEVPLAGWVDSQASTDEVSVSRKQSVSRADLYLTDPAADVRRGDRIRYGGETWVVEGFPDSPSNPFTGWQPYRVVSLTLVVG